MKEDMIYFEASQHVLQGDGVVLASVRDDGIAVVPKVYVSLAEVSHLDIDAEEAAVQLHIGSLESGGADGDDQ